MAVKRILLIGKTGQIDWELQHSLASLGRVIAPDRTQIFALLNRVSRLLTGPHKTIRSR